MNDCDLLPPPPPRIPPPPLPPPTIPTPNQTPPPRIPPVPPAPTTPPYFITIPPPAFITIPPPAIITVPPAPVLPYVVPAPNQTEFFIGNQAAAGAPAPGSQQVQTPATDPGNSAPWRGYTCTTQYDYDSGLLQGPNAGDSSISCTIVKVHNPIGQKIVRYSATRNGVQPLVPAPESTDPNCVLLLARVIPEQPYLDPGARTFIYHVEATYVYALLEPVTAADGFPVGVPGYTTLNSSDTALAADNFVKGIV